MAHTIMSGAGSAGGFLPFSIPFHVRLVFKGDGYGAVREDGTHACTHERDEPMVEFFDARYPHDPVDDTRRGQFVSRYYISELKRHTENGPCGLDLCGHAPSWKLDSHAVAEALGYAHGVVEAHAEGP
jgi:hypothetical protein